MSSKSTPSTSAPYQQHAQAASSAAAGNTHSSTGSLNEGLPSYRNAAAGVMGAPGAPLVSNAIPSSTAATSHKKKDEGPAPAAPAAGPTRTHLNPVAPEFSGQRGFLNAGTGTQQGQAGRGSIAFGQHVATGKAQAASTAQQAGATTPTPPAHRVQQVPQDSPGLDDFAHMGLIDDLLGAE